MPYSQMMIYFFDEDFGNVTFSSDEMGILSIDLNNINLDDGSFYEDDCDIIIHVTLIAWHNRIKKHIAFKKDVSKQSMHGVWHPTRWWNCCLPEDENKRTEPTLTDKN